MERAQGRFPVKSEVSSSHPRDPLILYDGLCALCNGWVRWVLRHDRREVFRFAPLQSAAARRVLSELDPPAPPTDTIVVIVDGRARIRSDAVLAVFAELSGVWRILRFGRVFPRCFRDQLYSFVARHRYSWFSPYSSCPLPPELDSSRWLES